MRRAVISWVVVFALFVGAFVTSVIAINGDLYSPHGFVQAYLETLARKDADAARAYPGVVTPTSSSTDLLTDSALGALRDIRFVSEKKAADGDYDVIFEYRLADESHRTQFTVTPNGSRLGLFSRWRFAESPLGTDEVSVKHESLFSVNKLNDTTGNSRGRAQSFLVFSPGLYVFDHESTYLSATDVSVAITEVGEVEQVDVEPTANGEFVDATTESIREFLDDCAKQQVLMPTGCPFGEYLSNRINDLPAWSIVDYPTVSIEPGTAEGTWLVAQASGTAHIRVEQKSVFDGSLKAIDKDIPFTADYVVTIGADDQLRVSAQFD